MAEYEFNDEQIFCDQTVSGICLARPALDRLRDVACEGGIDVLLKRSVGWFLPPSRVEPI